MDSNIYIHKNDIFYILGAASIHYKDIPSSKKIIDMLQTILGCDGINPSGGNGDEVGEILSVMAELDARATI